MLGEDGSLQKKSAALCHVQEAALLLITRKRQRAVPESPTQPPALSSDWVGPFYACTAAMGPVSAFAGVLGLERGL